MSCVTASAHPSDGGPPPSSLARGASSLSWLAARPVPLSISAGSAPGQPRNLGIWGADTCARQPAPPYGGAAVRASQHGHRTRPTGDPNPLLWVQLRRVLRSCHRRRRGGPRLGARRAADPRRHSVRRGVQSGAARGLGARGVHDMDACLGAVVRRSGKGAARVRPRPALPARARRPRLCAREQATARGERADVRSRRHRRVPGRPPEPRSARPALGAGDRRRRAAQLPGLLLERARAARRDRSPRVSASGERRAPASVGSSTRGGGDPSARSDPAAHFLPRCDRRRPCGARPLPGAGASLGPPRHRAGRGPGERGRPGECLPSRSAGNSGADHRRRHRPGSRPCRGGGILLGWSGASCGPC